MQSCQHWKFAHFSTMGVRCLERDSLNYWSWRSIHHSTHIGILVNKSFQQRFWQQMHHFDRIITCTSTTHRSGFKCQQSRWCSGMLICLSEVPWLREITVAINCRVQHFQAARNEKGKENAWTLLYDYTAIGQYAFQFCPAGATKHFLKIEA